MNTPRRVGFLAIALIAFALGINILGIIIFIIGTAFSTNVFAEGDLGRGEAKYKVCAACHGENGEGRKIANAPRISGQHSWLSLIHISEPTRPERIS